jgi:hypothetical protein
MRAISVAFLTGKVGIRGKREKALRQAVIGCLVVLAI